MNKLLDLADRASKLDGLIAVFGEKSFLEEGFRLLFPMPRARHSTKSDGSPWGGDGLGPYTEEYILWERRHKLFTILLSVGANLQAATMLNTKPYFMDLCETAETTRVQLVDSRGIPFAEARALTSALAVLAAALRLASRLSAPTWDPNQPSAEDRSDGSSL